ncbi:hypothetical protein SALBM135S_09159 [Streptomyces alboniger]
MPAAVSRWPTLVLTEPSAQEPGASAAPSRLKAWLSAATSIGSPSGVAVPWASTYETVSGPTSAISWASATTAACPWTLGAV